jgi:hypothetical protein
LNPNLPSLLTQPQAAAARHKLPLSPATATPRGASSKSLIVMRLSPTDGKSAV